MPSSWCLKALIVLNSFFNLIDLNCPASFTHIHYKSALGKGCFVNNSHSTMPHIFTEPANARFSSVRVDLRTHPIQSTLSVKLTLTLTTVVVVPRFIESLANWSNEIDLLRLSSLLWGASHHIIQVA